MSNDIFFPILLALQCSAMRERIWSGLPPTAMSVDLIWIYDQTILIDLNAEKKKICIFNYILYIPWIIYTNRLRLCTNNSLILAQKRHRTILICLNSKFSKRMRWKEKKKVANAKNKLFHTMATNIRRWFAFYSRFFPFFRTLESWQLLGKKNAKHKLLTTTAAAASSFQLEALISNAKPKQRWHRCLFAPFQWIKKVLRQMFFAFAFVIKWTLI